MMLHRVGLCMAAVILASSLAGCSFSYRNEETVDIPDNDLVSWAVSPVEVPKTFPLWDVNVTVQIMHPNLADLEAWIESPEGTAVPLFANLTGADLFNTTFDDDAAATVDTGAAPYTGTWLIDSFYPDASLNDFNGEDPMGTWTLNVRDGETGNVGEIMFFMITFNTPRD